MHFNQAMDAVVDEYTSDADLDRLWVFLGSYKLAMRKLYYEQRPKMKWRPLVPIFRKVNKKIDLIWDEMLKRQFCPSYYRYRYREGLQRPEWIPERNFLRHEIPSAFD